MIYNTKAALVNELTDNTETALYDVALEQSMNPGLKQACSSVYRVTECTRAMNFSNVQGPTEKLKVPQFQICCVELNIYLR